jgi:hypothetical protein
MDEKKLELMASADEEITRIVLQYELNKGVSELAECKVEPEKQADPIEQAMAPKVQKASETQELLNKVKAAIATPAEGPKSMDLVVCNVSKRFVQVANYGELGARARVPFDWVGVTSLILTEKPDDFKRVREICLEHMPDPAWHKSTGYANANKLMQRLQQDRLIGWNSKENRIEYLNEYK